MSRERAHGGGGGLPGQVTDKFNKLNKIVDFIKSI